MSLYHRVQHFVLAASSPMNVYICLLEHEAGLKLQLLRCMCGLVCSSSDCTPTQCIIAAHAVPANAGVR